MSNFNENSFTIRITEKPDGTIFIWSKGIPDTRSFAGKEIFGGDVPRPHLLGLFAIGKIQDAIKMQGWEESDESA